MKILYIGRERTEAEAAATALRAVAQGVAVSWTSRWEHAARWIQQNTDLAALVVEADLDPDGRRPVLDHIRGLASRPPVVVITSESAVPRTAWEDVEEFVARTPSLSRDVAAAVARALDRAATRQHPTREHPSAACAEVERQLAHARAALEDAEERCRSAAAAASEQAARQQAKYEIGMARAAATWEMVEEQLREAAQSVARSRGDQASAEANVDRLSRREAELSSLLSEAETTRAALERRLADAESGLERANARAARDIRAAAERFDERRRDLEAEIAREIQQRNDVEQTLARAVSERDAAEKRHASALAEEVARSRGLEDALHLARQEFESHAADLERRLAATDAAFQDAAARATRDRLAAATRAADREAALDAQILQERAVRAGMEQAIADGDAALRDARERYEAALAAAAQEREQRQAEFDRELAERSAARDAVVQRLTDAERALDQERRRHESAAAAIERGFAREAELERAVQRERQACARLEQAMADARAEFDRELAQTAAARDSLAQRLIDLEVELEEGRHEHQAAVAEIERLSQSQTDLASRLAAVDADRESQTARLVEAAVAIEDAAHREKDLEHRVEQLTRREAGLASQLDEVERARHALQLQLAAAVQAGADADERAARGRREAADRQADLEVRLGQAIDARDRLEVEINRLVAQASKQAAAFEEDNRLLAFERDVLQQSLDENEERLRELGAEHRNARQRFEEARAAADDDIERLTAERIAIECALEAARGDFQNTLHRLSRDRSETVAAHHLEIEQLQGQIAAANQMLQAAQQRENALQREADRVPPLLRQLDESRAESDRLFRQAQVAMFRCSRDGTLIDANRAWSILVRRATDHLRGAEAASIFESPNDLQWLVERCLSTRTRESIETTVRREDGARLFVRLSACAPAPDVIEIVAEDLTRPRVLQDRLAQAGRMEAVGRLASEVALTCRALLDDIRQKSLQLMMDAGGIGAGRPLELLLDDVTRASAHLQQLVAYGDKQTHAPAAVDLQTVVRDLAPVLKHVAGDRVDVRLPDPSSSLTVDVETERVERLLVNLAAYGRERMASGGRLTIELSTSIVDRQFTARHPNVRPGPHALITFTEVRNAARADGPLRRAGGTVAPGARVAAGHDPGVDLGTLQGLVGECGGHLWMKVQPLGDIVAKIRLPLRTTYGLIHAPVAAERGSRGGMIARLFQH